MKVADPFMRAQQQQPIAGQDPFAGRWHQDAFVPALNATDLNAETFHQLQILQGAAQPWPLLGHVQILHRNVVEFARETPMARA